MRLGGRGLAGDETCRLHLLIDGLRFDGFISDANHFRSGRAVDDRLFDVAWLGHCRPFQRSTLGARAGGVQSLGLHIALGTQKKPVPRVFELQGERYARAGLRREI